MNKRELLARYIALKLKGRGKNDGTFYFFKRSGVVYAKNNKTGRFFKVVENNEN